MPLLVRTWNVFQGQTNPPGRNDCLPEIARLATADSPDVVFIQELPVWGLPRLSRWSGMQVYAAVAVRPLLRPLARAERLVRSLATKSSPNSRVGQLLRVSVVGQANATLLAPDIRVLERRTTRLNPRSVRSGQGRTLGLGVGDRLKWAKERRICLSLVVELPDGRRAVVSNLHTTAYPDGAAEVEVERAIRMIEDLCRPGDICIVAGDFNLIADSSRILHELTTTPGGFSTAGPWVDHILVRGASATNPATWADKRRRVDGALLSDHAPLELRLT